MTDAIIVRTTPCFLHPFVVLSDELVSNVWPQAEIFSYRCIPP
jgi:hypothetical protein